MDRELISSEEFVKRVEEEIGQKDFYWPNLLGGLFLRYEYLFDTDGGNKERWRELVKIVNAAWESVAWNIREIDTHFFSYFESMKISRGGGRINRKCCRTPVVRKDGCEAMVNFNLKEFPRSLMHLLNGTEIQDVSEEKIAEILTKCVNLEDKGAWNDSERVDCIKPMSVMLKRQMEEIVLKQATAINAEKIVWYNAPDAINEREGQLFYMKNKSGIYSPLWGLRSQLSEKNVKLQTLLKYDFESMADPYLVEWVMGTEYYSEESTSNKHISKSDISKKMRNQIALEGKTLFAAYVPLVNSYYYRSETREIEASLGDRKYAKTVLSSIFNNIKKMTDGEAILCISYEKASDNALWGECLKELMESAHIHTILRLPCGLSEQRILRPIMAGECPQKVVELIDLVTDVIFLSKGEDNRCNDKRYNDKVAWVYDLRTNRVKVNGKDPNQKLDIKVFFEYLTKNRRRRNQEEPKWNSIRWKDIEEAKYRLDLDLPGIQGGTEVSLPYDLKNRIFMLKSEEKKELLLWLADQTALMDSSMRGLKKAVEYQKFKEWFFRAKGLPNDTAPMELLAEMAKDVRKKKSDAYVGGGVIDRSGFHRLKTGERKPNKKQLVHFAVNLELSDNYARLLFESAGFFLTEQDEVNIRKGINHDVSYLDDYYPEEKAERKGKSKKKENKQ